MSKSNNIISLCGFSGAGKTILAEEFAKKHPEYSFIDLDAAIEKKYSLTISEIFSSKGEDAFREYEYSALKETVNKALNSSVKFVIALGGGALTLDKTRKLVKERTFCIYLKCSPKVLAERIAEEMERKKRPLLKGVEDVEQWAKTLLEYRESFYVECSDAQIDTTVWNEPMLLSELSAFIEK